MAVSFEGLVVLSVKVFPEDLNVDCHLSRLKWQWEETLLRAGEISISNFL